MEGDKSDSETSEFEELKNELPVVKQMLANQNRFMCQISKSLREIQETLYAGNNNSIAYQQMKNDEKPSYKNSWNVHKIEGTFEFGDDGQLVTARGSGGLLRAMDSLPLKEHGIVYFELKIIDIPEGCELLIGLSQKMMAMSSFHVFKPAYEFKNKQGDSKRLASMAPPLLYSHYSTTIWHPVTLAPSIMAPPINGQFLQSVPAGSSDSKGPFKMAPNIMAPATVVSVGNYPCYKRTNDEPKNNDDDDDSQCKGHVIGYGVKFCAGKMFILRNGITEKTLELTEQKCGDGVDQKLTIKLRGAGCSVQLGHIEMSDDEGKCPF